MSRALIESARSLRGVFKPESDSEEEEEEEEEEVVVVKETTRERNKREKAEEVAAEKKAQELKRAQANRDRSQRHAAIQQRDDKARQAHIHALTAKHIAKVKAVEPDGDNDGWGVDPTDVATSVAAPVVPAAVHRVSPPPASPVKREPEPPPPSRARRLASGASDALSALFRSRIATATAGHIRSAVSSVMRGSSASVLPSVASVSVADASRSELQQLQADTTAVEQVAHEVDAAATAAEDALTPHSSRREVAQAVALRDAAASITEAATEQKEEIEAKLDESYMPSDELDSLFVDPFASEVAERSDMTAVVDVDPANNPLMNVILDPVRVEQIAGHYMGRRSYGGLGASDNQMYQWLWQAYATTNGTTELPIQADTPWLEYQMARLFGLRSGEHFRDDLDQLMVTHGAWQPAHVRKMQRLRDRAVAEINTAPLSPTMSADEYAAQLRGLIEALTGVRIVPLAPVARRATPATLAMLALVLCI